MNIHHVQAHWVPTLMGSERWEFWTIVVVTREMHRRLLGLP